MYPSSLNPSARLGSLRQTVQEDLRMSEQIRFPVGQSSCYYLHDIHDSNRGGPNEVSLRIAGFRGWSGDVIVLFALTVLAGVPRIGAARALPLHVDEPNTLLAAQMVAEQGLPVLPSGVLYLHGATQSYLLALLVRFGWGNVADLGLHRLTSVVAGTLSVSSPFTSPAVSSVPRHGQSWQRSSLLSTP
jgi:hypothetical protein